MKKILSATSIVVVMLAQGCASITSESMQNVTISTKTQEGLNVADAECSFKNDRGAWESKSSGHVAVHRSAEDLMVECKKEGLPDGLLRAISRAAGGMFGNIILGGGIGAIIDHNTGKGYNYPDDLRVVMGKSVVIDRRTEQKSIQQENESQQDE